MFFLRVLNRKRYILSSGKAAESKVDRCSFSSLSNRSNVVEHSEENRLGRFRKLGQCDVS